MDCMRQKQLVSERTRRRKSPFSPAEGRSGSSSLMAWKAAIEVANAALYALKHASETDCGLAKENSQVGKTARKSALSPLFLTNP